MSESSSSTNYFSEVKLKLRASGIEFNQEQLKQKREFIIQASYQLAADALNIQLTKDTNTLVSDNSASSVYEKPIYVNITDLEDDEDSEDLNSSLAFMLEPIGADVAKKVIIHLPMHKQFFNVYARQLDQALYGGDFADEDDVESNSQTLAEEVIDLVKPVEQNLSVIAQMFSKDGVSVRKVTPNYSVVYGLDDEDGQNSISNSDDFLAKDSIDTALEKIIEVGVDEPPEHFYLPSQADDAVYVRNLLDLLVSSKIVPIRTVKITTRH